MNTPKKNNPKTKLTPIEDTPKIITLVCYLLEYLGALTDEQLIEIATVDGIVSQILLGDALNTMEKKGLVTVNQNGAYSLDEEGKVWHREFENSLNIALRRKVLQEGKNVVRLHELRRAVKWRIVEVPRDNLPSMWAFQACFINEPDGSPFMDIKLYSKSKDGALNAQEKFLRDPGKTLNDTIANFM
ncbi:MAG: DUF4364 family protein [Oscillospiraceae bacterium]|nr:DUF4364 family protein [Oscillospiraceae bacterium]